MSGERIREKHFKTLKLAVLYLCFLYPIKKGYSFHPRLGFWGVLAC